MKIYIASDFDGNPTSVLLADSLQKAEIAWAAMNDIPHKIEVIDPNSATGINGLEFLLTSTKYNSQRNFGHKTDVDFRIWKRGI